MGRKRKEPETKTTTTTDTTTTTTTTTTSTTTASSEDNGIEPFKDSLFVLDRKFFSDSKLIDQLQECLSELGAELQIPKTAAVMTRTINTRANYFLVEKDEKKADEYPKALCAKKDDVKIVTADWVLESHKQKKNVEKPEYFLHPFDDDKKADDDDDGDKKDDTPEPPKKRQRKATTKAAAAAAADDDDDDKMKDDDKKADDKDDEDDKGEEKKKIIVKGKAAVDRECSEASTCHVIEEGSIVYDCMLNQTNIAGNNNKFYVCQALEADGGGRYYCWTRWGRVGERGQFKLMPCSSKAAAISEFCKKFHEKTKNSWQAIQSGTPFTPVSGKYTMIEIDYGNDDDSETKTEDKGAKKEAKPEVESKLDKRVQELIKLIFDMNMMESIMKELEFDCKKQPLGKLTKDQIKKGYQVLTEIEEEMKKSVSSSKLMELTNRFYTLIPHNFGRVRPPVINSQEMLKKKMHMLEALADIEIAAHIVDDTSKASSEFVNQLDANYARLNTDIQPVEPDSDEYKLIEKYVKNSHPKQTPSIANIFKIRRDSDEQRFEAKKGLGNRMLLWHGSRLTNYVGILSQGLRIAPPEAPCSGYRFGKGIYFADLAQLSTRYCRAYGQKYFCMLLADVALGKTADLDRDQFMTKALPGSDSTKALGTIEPDPAENFVREDGVVVPCGKIHNSGYHNVSCMEHQYIVYDVAQCRLQYLIQFKN